MVIENGVKVKRSRPLLFLSIVLVALALDLFFKWFAGISVYSVESGACPYPQCSHALLSYGEPCLNTANPTKIIDESLYSKEIIPNFFYIHLMNNTGAAWSFASGNNSLFIIFNIFFVIGSFYFMLRKNDFEIIPFICYSMIVGGAMGNFYDRLVHNSVRDFLSFIIPLPGGKSYSYPVFNGADMFICVGAILYLVDQIILVRFRNKKDTTLSPLPKVVKENGQ
jgi:signal peptidase II